MTNVRIDMSGFKTIKKALEDKYKTRVGILGDKATVEHAKTKETNAAIGAVHEFGSPSCGIPQRSFLRMPLETKLGEWVKKNKEHYFDLMKQGNVKKFYTAMGFASEDIIDQAFNTAGFGSWDKNRPYTIKKKGGRDTPLIDTTQLRKSISSKAMNRDDE